MTASRSPFAVIVSSDGFAEADAFGGGMSERSGSDFSPQAARASAARIASDYSSGTSHRPPSGGRVISAENGWPPHGMASATTPP